MRRRSGGLHSDSSEEFMMLAEYAQDRTGYYYDEALHAEVCNKLRTKFKRAASLHEPAPPHLFQGFDFATQDEEVRAESEELWAQSHTVEVNLVLICAAPLAVRAKLEEIWPDSELAAGRGEARALDLFVHVLRHGPQHVHCFKFWILDAEEAGSPIYASYLKRAKKVFRFGEGGAEWLPESEAKGVLFETVSALAD